MATDLSHVQCEAAANELRRQLDDAVADALQAQIFRDFTRDGGRYLMLAQAKLKAVARQCFDAQVCLDRPAVQQAGAVARAERIRGR
ncbi:hypothetical protein B0G75_12424 [Paraburkholderia sp. BL18I3N2]|uniref:hypothetical protein n=1 Tax=unclassified Paraburkholderia TaxID=2615204 RepID=UPI000D07316B|nr:MULTISPECIES: hypothetical protein [unclassified Paraburkholderia]PRX23981.1 hypothetical protein B0G75_12424 [Paraburkholderia sp. BL18I3N2]PRX95959.1 hypothetical protein B0G73_13168 [Paraburkholderia sp. BL25I1N1]